MLALIVAIVKCFQADSTLVVTIEASEGLIDQSYYLLRHGVLDIFKKISIEDEVLS